MSSQVASVLSEAQIYVSSSMSSGSRLGLPKFPSATSSRVARPPPPTTTTTRKQFVGPISSHSNKSVLLRRTDGRGREGERRIGSRPPDVNGGWAGEKASGLPPRRIKISGWVALAPHGPIAPLPSSLTSLATENYRKSERDVLYT